MSFAIAQRIRLHLTHSPSQYATGASPRPRVFYSRKRMGLVREYADVEISGDYRPDAALAGTSYWVTGKAEMVCRLAISRTVRWISLELSFGCRTREIQIGVDNQPSLRFRFRGKRRIRIPISSSGPIHKIVLNFQYSDPCDAKNANTPDTLDASVDPGAFLKEICFAKNWWRTLFLKFGTRK